jgi:SAM-dependent methyltransferase
MYSPRDYWTNVAEDFGEADAEGFAPILHPQTPTWFNRAIDDVQFCALRRAISLAAIPPGAQVLDVGCGTGRWLRRYGDVGFSPVGVDATIGMLRIAYAHRTTAPVAVGLAHSLPFSDAVFDAISSITVVQHIPYEVQASALREMIRVLRPGGRMILFELIRGQGSHVFPRQPRDWVREVESLGADLIDWFGEEFFFPDRLLVGIVQALMRRRGDLVGQVQSAATGSFSAEYSVPRRLYWHLRRITVSLSAWSEQFVARIFPPSLATHAVCVFRKKP